MSDIDIQEIVKVLRAKREFSIAQMEHPSFPLNLSEINQTLAAFESLQARVDELEAENEAMRSAISDALQTLFPCRERNVLGLAINPDMMHPPQDTKDGE